MPHRDSRLPPSTRRILHVDLAAAQKRRAEVVRAALGFSPRVELASATDLVVDLTGSARLFGAACGTAERMLAAIGARTGLPVAIGIGSSRTLARLAVAVVGPGTIVEVLPGHELAFLARMPVGHLPGLEPAIGRALGRFAIRTIGELALVSREVLFASFGPRGLALHDRARGIDPEPVHATHALDENGELVTRAPGAIRRAATFAAGEGRPEQVEAMLAGLVERAAARLRDQGLVAGGVEVRLEYQGARPADRRHERVGPPVAGTGELARRARALLRGLPRRRALVELVEVTLSHLQPNRGLQRTLFVDPALERERRLERALDALRERGTGRVVRAASLSTSGPGTPTGAAPRGTAPALDRDEAP